MSGDVPDAEALRTGPSYEGGTNFDQMVMEESAPCVANGALAAVQYDRLADALNELCTTGDSTSAQIQAVCDQYQNSAGPLDAVLDSHQELCGNSAVYEAALEILSIRLEGALDSR